MSLDRAVEAAAEALIREQFGRYSEEAARIAVEAAAPEIPCEYGNLQRLAEQRAERAEAEVEQFKLWLIKAQNPGIDMERVRAERAEAEAKAANDAYRGVIQWAEPLNQRCNRAEAEVAKLRKDFYKVCDDYSDEAALADRLAEALKRLTPLADMTVHPSPPCKSWLCAALAAWEEARREV